MSEIRQSGEENNDWKYSPTDGAPEADTSNQAVDPAEPVTLIEEYSWSALDTFSDHKSLSWYTVLGILTLICAVIIYLITKDKITTAVVIFCGFVLGYYAAKKPKTVNYQISESGFKVGDRFYKFGNFKSFSIVQHGDSLSAVLVPLRRFMPYTYINFTKDIENKITDTLTKVLPKESSRQDFIDNFTRRVGF